MVDTAPDGTVDVAYSYQFEGVGGVQPYTWSVSVGSLPAGLSLSSGGLLSGTPTTQESATFTVQVTDDVATIATREITIEIASGAGERTVMSGFGFAQRRAA